VFRNLQVRSKLLRILAVPLLALMALAAVQAASSVGNRLEAERLGPVTRFASSVTALVDGLQRERAISSGYVASGKKAGNGTMVADRVLVDTTLQSFQRERRMLAGGGVSARLRADAGAAATRLDELPGFRSKLERQPLIAGQVAGWYGERIDSLLVVLGDLDAQHGSRLLGGNVEALLAAAQTKEAASQAQALLFAALTAGSFGADDYQRFAALAGEEGAGLARFRQAAASAQRDFLDQTVRGPDVQRTETMRQAALTARSLPEGIAAEDWFSASSVKLGLLHQVELRVAGDLIRASSAAKSVAIRRTTTELVAIAIGVALAIGSSLLLGRSMTRPLVRLERCANEVASTDLPDVVARLQRAGEADEPTAIAQQAACWLPIRSTDEIGRLAFAFNAVQRVAVRAATEQAALRKSIGDMFVNLARRNQTLIDRQLNLIEELERRSDDPDRLRELFQLEGLATRMRRSAGSLLVLAGAESVRRWSEPVSLADVLRTAAAEVEDFDRVELTSGNDVRVIGRATSDVVHLLAELIENAITFSPPDTPVKIDGKSTAAGYLLEIEDRGLGMTEDEIVLVNERLANPPEVDFALSRMLGFFVVGRLARRHGIQVRLRPSWYGGVKALVLIPSSLLLTEREMARSMATGVPPMPAGGFLPEGAASTVAQLPVRGAWPERREVVPGRSLFEPEPPPEPAAPPEEPGQLAGVRELFDDYRTGMVHGHSAGRGRRAVRPPVGPSGGPPDAS
jgi:signal transduction histidine kinase